MFIANKNKNKKTEKERERKGKREMVRSTTYKVKNLKASYILP